MCSFLNNKRKDNIKKAIQLETSNNEISKKLLGESKYEDWYEVIYENSIFIRSKGMI